MSEPQKIIRARCNNCAHETKHRIVSDYSRQWSEEVKEGFSIDGDDRYQILQCEGCDTICVRHASRFSEDYDDRGRPVTKVVFYPPRTIRRLPAWLSGVEGNDLSATTKFIPRLLEEVYRAFQSDSLSLAAMGIRAILERVMIDQVGDQGTFSANLAAFQTAGHIAANSRKVVEAALDVGHAAIHRNYLPTADELRFALDVTENIIERIYIQHPQAKAVHKRIPARRKNRKSKKPTTP